MLSTGVNKSRHHELFKHYDHDDNGYVDGEEITVRKSEVKLKVLKYTQDYLFFSIM